MKQLGAVFASPLVTIIFSLIVNLDFTIDIKRVTISLVSMAFGLLLFNNSYQILINLDKRINYVRS